MPWNRHLFVGQFIEKCQREFSDNEGHDKCKTRHYERFTQELRDELDAPRSCCFSDAYFFCTLLTAGSTQIHEVYAGQQQDKGSDDTKEPDKLYSSTRQLTIFEFAVEMPLVHGMQQDLLCTFFTVLFGNIFYPRCGIIKIHLIVH